VTRFLFAFLVAAIEGNSSRCGRGDLAFETMRYAALLEATMIRDAIGGPPFEPWPRNAPGRRAVLDAHAARYPAPAMC